MMQPPSFGVRAIKSTNERQIEVKIKSWISERMTALQNYDANRFQFIVNEIQCAEPGCVPIETIIVIIDITYSGRYRVLFLRCFMIKVVVNCYAAVSQDMASGLEMF